MMFLTEDAAVALSLSRPLTGAQVKMLSLLLVRRESELRALLEPEPTAEPTIAPTAAPPADAAAPDHTRPGDPGLAAQRQSELQRVRAARARLDNGSYGRCAQCTEAIDFRRLVALPTTERCGPCDVAHERWHSWTRLGNRTPS